MGARRRRQTHDELAPLARPATVDADVAVVELDEAADESQADTQSSLGTVQRSIGLGKEIEDARKHLGAQANAVVAHSHNRFVALEIRGQDNLAAPIRVLGGVVQQVRNNLARRVGSPSSHTGSAGKKESSSWPLFSIKGREVSTACRRIVVSSTGTLRR